MAMSWSIGEDRLAAKTHVMCVLDTPGATILSTSIVKMYASGFIPNSTLNNVLLYTLVKYLQSNLNLLNF